MDAKKTYPALTALFFALCSAAFPAQGQNFKSKSVLADGKSYKIAIPKTGVYKITYEWLQSKGASLAGPAANIQLFSNGGKALPQLNSENRQDDLLEIPIEIQGEADGVFGPGDYILFFAQGADTVFRSEKNALLDYERNIYANANYCFLKTGGGVPGKRIAKAPAFAQAAPTLSVFDDLVYHETNLYNIVKGGRAWLGDQFNALIKKEYTLDIPGISSSVSLEINVAAKSEADSYFKVTSNGAALGDVPIAASSSEKYGIKCELGHKTFQTAASTQIKLSLEYSKPLPLSYGYLQNIKIRCQRNLALYGGQTLFRSFKSTENAFARYQIAGAAGARVWETGEAGMVLSPVLETSGNNASFVFPSEKLREFIVFTPEGAFVPAALQNAALQNLHALPVPDMAIVSAPEFMAEAARLAVFHEKSDGFTVAVVSTDQVYNEFSGGKQDVSAIRDFFRMMYERGQAGGKKIRYGLLFGDGSYDYLNRLSGNSNFVPAYQSRTDFDPIESITSDDFFALLQAKEGFWDENLSGAEDLDIGIGRIPANGAQQAKRAVDKIIAYAESPQAKGDWRNLLVFVADDGDGNTHQLQADQLAIDVESKHPEFRAKKIFLDAFAQEQTPRGVKSPATQLAINRSVDQGALIVNYTGHGGQTAWTNEGILNTADILGWSNKNALPLFVTATCEFGRFDDPNQTSGAEEAVFKETGGAIAMITTTRPVFSSDNYHISQELYKTVLAKGPDGRYMRLGDVVRQTKNGSGNLRGTRNFSLLGDPALRLSYPEKTIRIAKPRVGGVLADTLKAQSLFALEGDILGTDGQPDANFQGEAVLRFFDKPSLVKTLGEEGEPMEFMDLKQELFRGRAKVTNGRFRFEGILPKDLDYRYGKAKMFVYAADPKQNTDALGGSSDFYVGGSALPSFRDSAPPQIRLFINDTLFKDGGSVAGLPLLIAKFDDESGINISSAGIGHDITMELDGQTVRLNDDYQTETGTFKKGFLSYPLGGLKPGEHQLKLTAWDNFNNFSEQEIRFVVTEGDGLRLTDIKAWPNPAAYGNFNISLSHNRPGEALDAELFFYTPEGRLVGTLSQSFLSSPSVLEGFEVSPAVLPLSNGIYIVKAVLHSPADGAFAAGFVRVAVR